MDAASREKPRKYNSFFDESKPDIMCQEKPLTYWTLNRLPSRLLRRLIFWLCDSVSEEPTTPILRDKDFSLSSLQSWRNWLSLYGDEI